MIRFHELLKVMPPDQPLVIHYPNGYVSKDSVSDYNRRHEKNYALDSLYNYIVFHMFSKGKYIVVNLVQERI